MYQYQNQKDALALLWRAGFTHGQIDRLTRFRRDFVPGEMDRTATEHRRLEFARWLFLTGKLTDQIHRPGD